MIVVKQSVNPTFKKVPTPSASKEYVDKVVNTKFSFNGNFNVDSIFFYEKTTAHLDDSAPIEKIQRRLNFLQNARYYTVTQVHDRKSTQPIRNVHYVQLLNEHLC